MLMGALMCLIVASRCLRAVCRVVVVSLTMIRLGTAGMGRPVVRSRPNSNRPDTPRGDRRWQSRLRRGRW